jgi:hypothetical protein
MTARRRLPDARMRLLAARIHPLGERPLFELLRELDRGAELHDALERYARLFELRHFIRDLGGEQLPPRARRIA